MYIASEFRKILGIRIIMGLFLFVITLSYVVYNGFSTSEINPLTVMAYMVLFFLVYCFPDLFKIFKLTITEEGIEKTMVITGAKQFIPFDNIQYIKKGKVKLRNKTGDISDGYYFTTLMLENKKSLVISPDHFENYKILITNIEDNFK
ncbi:hypothetical protein AAFH68_11160 [Flavobacterium sp. CGRL1]